ncbi:MAG TPA: hypothetical protein VHV10_08685, partial [Ktedonobacteraceae bacterium]|nr:hypothetical protein [Ktedonobacteraceae bacterium]
MDNIVELLCIEVGKVARDEEHARFLVGEMAKLPNWKPYLRKDGVVSNIEQRLAALETWLGQKTIEQAT